MKLRSNGHFSSLKEVCFHMLTDIDIDTRLHEAFLTKGRRIINFFLNQRLKWSQDIQALLREMEHESMNNHQVPIAAILLLMKYFQEKEDHIFILRDVKVLSLYFLYHHSKLKSFFFLNRNYFQYLRIFSFFFLFFSQPRPRCQLSRR